MLCMLGWRCKTRTGLSRRVARHAQAQGERTVHTPAGRRKNRNLQHQHYLRQRITAVAQRQARRRQSGLLRAARHIRL